jgi:predicted CXXCH cytochrome family protein
VDDLLTWSPFSSTGAHISLVAPGVGVYSTIPGGSYSATSGTSISSAQVSGVAALLAGQPQFNNANTLRSALLNSAHDLGSPGHDPYYGYGVVHVFDAMAYAGPILPTPTPWIVPTSTPGGSGGVYSMSFQDLWATAQIYSFTTTNPANSIDSAFNDLLAFNTGLWGGATRSWTFATFDDTTLTAVAKVDLELRFYMTGWVNDTYYIQIYDNTNPACISGWCTVYTLKFIPTSSIEGQPPSVLTTLTVPVTSILNTVARVNAAQVRIAGSGVTGGVTDSVTIYIDEVRLHMLDVLPPTATPTSTAIFIPTSTLPAVRAITATPIAGEPHNNFMSATTDECATCHRSHTAKSMGLRKLTGEEQVCFSCHTSGGTGTNVQPAFTLAAILAFPNAMWNVKTVILLTPQRGQHPVESFLLPRRSRKYLTQLV